MIVEEEQKGKERAEYGVALLKNLSIRLTGEFGAGFDERELRRMRQFYLSSPIRGALRPELAWTHYRDENLWPNAVIQIRVENRLSASRFECIQINQ